MSNEKRVKIYSRPKQADYNVIERHNEDPEVLVRPCFKVGKDVQLKEFPTSGEEYLLTVITERKNILKVTKCDVDLTKFKNKQTVFVKEIPITPFPMELKPMESQDIVVYDFEQTRQTIATARANKRNLNFEIEDWGHFGMDRFAPWGMFFNKEPKVSCVLGLNQLQIENGLIDLTKMLKKLPAGTHISHLTGSWIYTFLVCLNEPLLADTVSVLRTLARHCADKMSQIDIEEGNAAALAASYNLFITLVTRYFRQYDLAD